MMAKHTGLRFLQDAGESPASGEAEENLRLEETPEAWREGFRGALALGDTNEAEKVVGELPDGFDTLATFLRGALQEFRLDELETLFKPRTPS